MQLDQLSLECNAPDRKDFETPVAIIGPSLWLHFLWLVRGRFSPNLFGDRKPAFGAAIKRNNRKSDQPTSKILEGDRSRSTLYAPAFVQKSPIVGAAMKLRNGAFCCMCATW